MPRGLRRQSSKQVADRCRPTRDRLYEKALRDRGAPPSETAPTPARSRIPRSGRDERESGRRLTDDEAESVADRALQRLAIEESTFAQLDAEEWPTRHRLSGEPPYRRNLRSSRAVRRSPGAGPRSPEALLGHRAHAGASCETQHRDVVVAGVQSRDACAQFPRASETVLQEGCTDAFVPCLRIDTQSVDPGFAVAEEGDLADADDASLQRREPKASAAIARPLREGVENVVVVTPYGRDDSANSAPIGGSCPSDRDTGADGRRMSRQSALMTTALTDLRPQDPRDMSGGPRNTISSAGSTQNVSGKSIRTGRRRAAA
jgi:hypothetical protein